MWFSILHPYCIHFSSCAIWSFLHRVPTFLYNMAFSTQSPHCFAQHGVFYTESSLSLRLARKIEKIRLAKFVLRHKVYIFWKYVSKPFNWCGSPYCIHFSSCAIWRFLHRVPTFLHNMAFSTQIPHCHWDVKWKSRKSVRRKFAFRHKVYIFSKYISRPFNLCGSPYCIHLSFCAIWRVYILKVHFETFQLMCVSILHPF